MRGSPTSGFPPATPSAVADHRLRKYAHNCANSFIMLTP